MLEGVARAGRLALGGSRAGGAQGVGSVGGELAFAHAFGAGHGVTSSGEFGLRSTRPDVEWRRAPKLTYSSTGRGRVQAETSMG